MNINIHIIEALEIPHMDLGKSDPYIVLYTSYSGKQATKIIKNSDSPFWDEKFVFQYSEPYPGDLFIECFDEDIKYDDIISTYQIPLLLVGQKLTHDFWLQLVPSKKNKTGGKLHLKIEIAPADQTPFASPVPTALGDMLFHVKVIEAIEVPKMDLIGSCDPWGLIQIAGEEKSYNTEVLFKTLTPVWNAEFSIPLKSTFNNFDFTLWDQDGRKSEKISTLSLPISLFSLNTVIDTWLNCVPEKGVKTGGKVHFWFHLASKTYVPPPPIVQPVYVPPPVQEMSAVGPPVSVQQDQFYASPPVQEMAAVGQPVYVQQEQPVYVQQEQPIKEEKKKKKKEKKEKKEKKPEEEQKPAESGGGAFHFNIKLVAPSSSSSSSSEEETFTQVQQHINYYPPVQQQVQSIVDYGNQQQSSFFNFYGGVNEYENPGYQAQAGNANLHIGFKLTGGGSSTSASASYSHTSEADSSGSGQGGGSIQAGYSEQADYSGSAQGGGSIQAGFSVSGQGGYSGQTDYSGSAQGGGSIQAGFSVSGQGGYSGQADYSSLAQGGGSIQAGYSGQAGYSEQIGYSSSTQGGLIQAGISLPGQADYSGSSQGGGSIQAGFSVSGQGGYSGSVQEGYQGGYATSQSATAGYYFYQPPQFHISIKIVGQLKPFYSCHNKYLSAQPDGTLQWNRDKQGSWEGFTITQVGENQFTFLGFHGKYISADQNGNLFCNRDKAAEWETFTVQRVEEHWFSIRTFHGKYISAQPNGTAVANRIVAAPWENIMIPEQEDAQTSGPTQEPKIIDNVALGSIHGRYLGARPDGYLQWNLSRVTQWERFTFISLGNSQYQIKTYDGRFLSSTQDGKINSLATQAGQSEIFTVSYINNQLFTIKTSFGLYVSSLPNGYVDSGHQQAGQYETFKIYGLEIVQGLTPIPEPEYLHLNGSKRLLISAHKRFLSAPLNQTVQWNSTFVTDSEQFDFVKIKGHSYNIRTSSGKFLSSGSDGRVSVVDNPSANEVFKVKKIDKKKFPGFIKIKNSSDRYLSANINGAVQFNADQRGEWETIQMNSAVPVQKKQKSDSSQKKEKKKEEGLKGSQKGLRSIYGKFLSAQPDGTLQWNRDTKSNWENFEIYKVDKNHFNLKTHFGRYVSAEPSGYIVANRIKPTQWETFEIVESVNGYSIKTFHGKYISATQNGGIEGNRDQAGESETFKISVTFEFFVAPQGAPVSQISIAGRNKGFKSIHAKFLSVSPDGNVTWNRDAHREWETFEVIQVDPSHYYLKSYHGKFLCVEPNGKIIANRDKPAQWETFEIVNFGYGFSIKTFHGKYLSAQPNGSIDANRDRVAQWETFQVAEKEEVAFSIAGANKGFRSFHKKFLSAQPNGTLQWNREVKQIWESFEIIQIDPSHYHLKTCHRKFLCVEPNGKIIANRDKPAQWETFEIVKAGNGYSIKTFHGKYLSAQPNGTVQANRDRVAQWETVDIY